MSGSSARLKYLNVRETAARFGVHENTIRNWVREGKLVSSPLPGSRFHRFDEREVERLLRQRRAVTPSVQAARSTIGPELIDAPQLDQWASTPDAPHRFPELIRRLLAATPGITNVAMRAGSGVVISGWDGQAESRGTSFLPAGSLYFELSTSKNPKSKADENWQNRCDDPRGVVPGESVFVFATSRRWPGGASWAAERRQEGVFADVRVLDADDLEGWLQETPRVHYWFSEQLGRRPKDAETWEKWWSRFRSQTKPELPPALFLAGRDDARAQLIDFFGRLPGVLYVEAPWRDDAVAFVCTTIESIEPAAAAPQPLVVHSREVWDRIIQERGPTTLIPLFEEPDIATAQVNGHSLIVPLDREQEQVTRGAVIKLPPPHRRAATEAFEAAELDLEKSNRLAALARRSMPALVRKLSVDPRVNRPLWSQPPDATIVIPLVFLGAWTSDEDDRDIASRVTERPWDEIERTLRRLQIAADPPFKQSAKVWRLVSHEEAFLVARDLFTMSDLQRWREIAVEVLLELDPQLDLPPDRRPYAQIDGVARRYSSELRRGIAAGIAVIGTMEEEPLADGRTGADHARALVHELLERANTDETGRTWASLSDVLPLLAEAVPQEFLDAVSTDLDRAEPVLATMFQDEDGDSWLYSSSPHTGLLWALETLCWSSDWIVEACHALARFQEIDPGGRLGNRPLGSLSNVLLGWIRNTGAPLDQRMRTLDTVCRYVPAVGWQLLLQIWRSGVSTSTPPAAPRFRDWKPDTSTVTVGEWVAYTGHVVQWAIKLAEEDPLRWAELAERLDPLPPDDRNRVLAFLDSATTSRSLTFEERVRVWEHLRSVVERRRRGQQAGKPVKEDLLARLEQIVARLEPSDQIERFGYLFDGHPQLPDVDPVDHAAHDDRLRQMREEAVRQALADETLDQLVGLARHVSDATELGRVVAAVAAEDLTLRFLEWLDSPDDKLNQMAHGLARRKLFDRDGGAAWLRSALELPVMQVPSRRWELAMHAPSTRQIWATLDDLDSDLARVYWEKARFYHVALEDAAYAARRLLDHDRAWAAIDVLALAVHEASGASSPVTPDLVKSVLAAAISSDPRGGQMSGLGYEVGQLLDYLEAEGTDLETLAQLEFDYFDLIDRNRGPKALFAFLGSSAAPFVDLVKRVYRGANEPKRQLDEDEAAQVRHVWWVLNHWRTLPGLQADGTIDATHLNSWVDEVRLGLSDADRADVGDEVIGQVLATSPPGSDGIWPAEPVRDVVERIGSSHLESGLSIGRFNARGATTRGVYDGGLQEQELAGQYRAWSKQIEATYPRTSRLLRRMAETYTDYARKMDEESEIWADS